MTTHLRSLRVLALWLPLAVTACDIQASHGTASVEPSTAPAGFPADPSGLLGVTPATLRMHAQRFGGKALLVNFWASFCGSCKRELPMLRSLHGEFAAEGVGLMLLSADAPEDREKAVAMLREAGLPLPSHHVLGSVSGFKRSIEPRWKGALPATLLLDADGRVRYFWNGPVLDDEVRPVLQGFLAGEHIDGMRDFVGEPEG